MVQPSLQRDRDPRSGTGKERRSEAPPPLPLSSQTGERRRSSARRPPRPEEPRRRPAGGGGTLEAVPIRRERPRLDSIVLRKTVNPRVAEAASAEAIPVPNASGFMDHTSPSLRLRRDESVIAAAVSAKRNPAHNLQRAVKRGFVQVRTFFREDLPAAIEGIQSVIHSQPRGRALSGVAAHVAQQIDRLPAKKKAVIVGAPYALALILALVFISGSRSAGTNIVEIAPQPAAVPAVAAAVVPAAPAPVAPEPAPEVPEPAAAAPLPVAVTEEPAAEEEAAAPAMEIVRTLTIRGALRAAPKTRAAKVARLAAGAEVLIYPGVAAPAGWVVARKPGGAIGFLRTRTLEERALDETPPKTRAKPKRSKAKKQRRSRSVEAPWPS